MAVIPFDDRDGFIWLDGKLVPWRDAKINVLTHGLHYASSVFEGERVYSGRIYKHAEHTKRLFESARILDMEIPFAEKEIFDACYEVARAQGIENGYVRPIAFRGSASTTRTAFGSLKLASRSRSAATRSNTSRALTAARFSLALRSLVELKEVP